MRQSSFFDGVTQIEAVLEGLPVRLPIFYYDGSSIGAVFPARLRALRQLMPDPRIVPARLAPGVGAVAITCFEYRDTDIGPYNELAISVMLADPAHRNLPGAATIAGLRRRQLHAWVHHLPVTTEIARLGGVELYNYPKFIASIDFEHTATGISCALAERGEHILTLSGDAIATPRSERVQLFSHLWMDRQPQGSEFKINARQIGMTVDPRRSRLELGRAHPIARELAGLLLSRRPIQYQRIAAFEGILYGPDHLSLPLIERFAQRVRAATAQSGEPAASPAGAARSPAVAAAGNGGAPSGSAGRGAAPSRTPAADGA